MSYPLRFERMPVPKPWAGSRLRRLFPDMAREIPASTGETIELADIPGQQSVIANGKWHGRSIRDVMESNRTAMLGELSDAHDLHDFPVAIKFLDTAEALSIQDHPSDQRQDGRLVKRGKSECWIVLDCDDGAFIYQGLKPGVSPKQFEQAIDDGSVPETLNQRAVRPGDFLYNDAGMIHAIGGGLTLLEIQQNCPTTYRLFDFPRDKKREMHVQAGLAAARFDLELPQVLKTNAENILLAPDGAFGVRSLRVNSAFEQVKDWAGFTAFTCVEGACEISGIAKDNLQPAKLKPGDTVLYTNEFARFEIYPGAWLIQSWARE